MDPERYQRIKELLFEASTRSGVEREAFLDEACDGDEVLRVEILQLLDTRHETADVFVPLVGAGAVDVLAPGVHGAYRVEREVGRGGMGVVYAAVDEARGRPVALKVVHPHLVSDHHSVERFLREARAGEAVRHENVIQALGVENLETGGRVLRVLVMEYAEGRTLRTLLDDLGTVPEGLLLEIAAQIASGLAAIHAAGIVHRDLKPENVLLTDDQRVRIMDLGVAKLCEASVELTREGHFVGSLLYAAPEQFDSRTVGAVSDLYSLGVLLYELATGTNPFRGDTPAATMVAHLKHVPDPVQARNPAVSPFLGELIATLLEKDPGDRIGSADAVAALLVEGQESAWWARRQSTVRRAASRMPAVPVGRDTDLIGRGDELALLDEAWEQAVSGIGRTVLLVGEAGIGKTRVADAFLGRIARQEVHALYGSFPPTGGLRPLFQSVLDAFPPETLEQRLAACLPTTRSLAPALAALLRGEPPAPSAGALPTEVVRALFADLLRGLAAERPTVWVIDDLHFAPDEAHALALALSRGVERSRALVLLTSRPGLDERTLQSLRAIPSAVHVPLARLPASDVTGLVRAAFGSDSVADQIGPRIAERSDGVPLFVVETLRALEEGGFVIRAEDGTVRPLRDLGDVDVPSAVRGLIEARMAELSRDEHTVLDVGAVLGYAFDAELVAAVLERPLVSVLRDLAELERNHGIVRSSGRDHRFDHHQFQEVVYESLPGRLRQEYHALLAEVAAARSDAPPEALDPEDVVFLATHHLRGSRPAAALPYIGWAIQALVDRNRVDEAAAVLDLALADEQLFDPSRRVDLLLRQSGFYDRLGRAAEQRACAERALAEAQPLGDPGRRARALMGIADADLLARDLGAARGCFELALAAAREAGDEVLERRALFGIGSSFSRERRRDKSRGPFARCLEMAVRQGDRQGEAEALHELGVIHSFDHRLAEGRKAFARSLELFEEIGDVEGEAGARLSLGYHHLHVAEFDAARAHFERARTLAERHGLRRLQLRATASFGLVATEQGRHAEALDSFRRAKWTALETGDRAGYSRAVLNEGIACTELGDLRRARDLLRESLDLAREIRDPALEQFTLLRLGHLAVASRDPETARGLFLEVIDDAERTGWAGGLAEAHVTLSDLEAEQGRESAALEHIDAAARALAGTELSDVGLFVEVRALALRGGAAQEARDLFAKGRGTLSRGQMLEALYLLWRATGDVEPLRRARDLQRELLDSVPSPARAAMVEHVVIHRQVREAWERRAEG